MPSSGGLVKPPRVVCVCVCVKREEGGPQKRKREEKYSSPKRGSPTSPVVLCVCVCVCRGQERQVESKTFFFMDFADTKLPRGEKEYDKEDGASGGGR